MSSRKFFGNLICQLKEIKGQIPTDKSHLPVNLVGGNHIGGLVILGGSVAAHSAVCFCCFLGVANWGTKAGPTN